MPNPDSIVSESSPTVIRASVRKVSTATPPRKPYRGYVSYRERALYLLLDIYEIPFIRGWWVPETNFRVDAFSPAIKVAFEADGYHHVYRRAIDTRRDEAILATGYVDEILRFTKSNLKRLIPATILEQEGLSL